MALHRSTCITAPPVSCDLWAPIGLNQKQTSHNFQVGFGVLMMSCVSSAAVVRASAHPAGYATHVYVFILLRRSRRRCSTEARNTFRFHSRLQNPAIKTQLGPLLRLRIASHRIASPLARSYSYIFRPRLSPGTSPFFFLNLKEGVRRPYLGAFRATSLSEA